MRNALALVDHRLPSGVALWDNKDAASTANEAAQVRRKTDLGQRPLPAKDK